MRTDRLFAGVRLLERLHRSVGDRIELLDVRGEPVGFVIAGTLDPAVSALADRAVIDIAAAQYLEGMVGRLSRVDVRVRPGIDEGQLRTQLTRALPAGVTVIAPLEGARSDAQVSRAYRINLSVLALVALFCGSLLIFSAQALQVARRRAHFALLRALGLTEGELLLQQLIQALLLGSLGALLGACLAYGIAALALAHLGADLGSGFFRGVTPSLRWDGTATGLYTLGGILAALAGAALPALEAARVAPARGLKPGALEDAWRPLTQGRSVLISGLALLLAAMGFLLMPPVGGVPVGGYLAIACVLLGSVVLTPRVLVLLLGVLSMALRRRPAPNAVALISVEQLRGAPSGPAVSLAAMVASVSLAVAMMIMVNSFRVSFQSWLEQVLPAQAYLGDAGLRLSADEQARIGRLPQVGRVEFLRSDELRLSPDQVPMMLLARDIDPANPRARLPLVEGPMGAGLVASMAAERARRALDEGSLATRAVPLSALPPVWVSEAAAALTGLTVGQFIDLPIGGQTHRFRVDGIWRDYARQQGAIVIERAHYQALTGDLSANIAALWLAPAATLDELRAALGWLDGRSRLKDVGSIRAFSLTLFDRTFVVTYALVAVSVLIGLIALAGNLATLVLARRGELSVLRHLGVALIEITRMIALQALLIVLAALIMGVSVGWVIGRILIEVVNRDSFHWSMDLHVPWGAMGALALLLAVLALLTGWLSARAVRSADVIRSVTEDW